MTDLNQLIKQIPTLNIEREYWFVRTNTGHYYETYKQGGFIGIGWNDITVEDIRNSLENTDALRTKLVNNSITRERKRAEEDGRDYDARNVVDPLTSKGKSKLTSIITKLQTFYSLRKGDVVVIPNRGSSRFCFGIIDDDTIDIKNNNENNCIYRKRRKVRWATEKSFLDIGPFFYHFKKNMHSISSVKDDLAAQIDKVMNDIYFKNNKLYYKIRVNKARDIKAKDLFLLGADLIELLEFINEKFGFNEDISSTIVKANVNSKGDLLFVAPVVKSMLILTVLLSLVSCDDDPNKIGTDTSSKAETIKNVKERMDSMESKVHKY